jgi:hypothetical protein
MEVCITYYQPIEQNGKKMFEVLEVIQVTEYAGFKRVRLSLKMDLL